MRRFLSFSGKLAALAFFVVLPANAQKSEFEQFKDLVLSNRPRALCALVIVLPTLQSLPYTSENNGWMLVRNRPGRSDLQPGFYRELIEELNALMPHISKSEEARATDFIRKWPSWDRGAQSLLSSLAEGYDSSNRGSPQKNARTTALKLAVQLEIEPFPSTLEHILLNDASPSARWNAAFAAAHFGHTELVLRIFKDEFGLFEVDANALTPIQYSIPLTTGRFGTLPKLLNTPDIGVLLHGILLASPRTQQTEQTAEFRKSIAEFVVTRLHEGLKVTNPLLKAPPWLWVNPATYPEYVRRHREAVYSLKKDAEQEVESWRRVNDLRQGVIATDRSVAIHLAGILRVAEAYPYLAEYFEIVCEDVLAKEGLQRFPPLNHELVAAMYAINPNETLERVFDFLRQRRFAETLRELRSLSYQNSDVLFLAQTLSEAHFDLFWNEFGVDDDFNDGFDGDDDGDDDDDGPPGGPYRSRVLTRERRRTGWKYFRNVREQPLFWETKWKTKLRAP